MPPTHSFSEPEVIESGRGSTPDRRLTVLLALVLSVSGLLGWGVYAARAAEERTALARCAEEADRAVGNAEGRLAATATYIAPSLGVATPRLDTSLLMLIEYRVDAVVGPVTEALTTCRGVDLWPVSQSRQEARAAYVALLEAERRRLEEISQDGAALYRGYDAIRDLSDKAAALLED